MSSWTTWTYANGTQMEHQWNTSGTQMEYKLLEPLKGAIVLADVLPSGLLSLYFVILLWGWAVVGRSRHLVVQYGGRPPPYFWHPS